jgi:PIN domain nuclease of toxin-antitoxin system
MRLLLDTHAFLWFILSDGKVSSTAHRLISDPSNVGAVTAASYWEIASRFA